MPHKKKRKKTSKHRYKAERYERLQRLFCLLEHPEEIDGYEPEPTKPKKDGTTCQVKEKVTGDKPNHS